MTKSVRQRDYEMAFQLVKDSLSKRHPGEISKKSGAFVEEKGGRTFLELEYMARRCIIPHPEIDVYYEDGEREMPLWNKVLILHYLDRASGIPLKGELITFNNVESGTFYMPAYRKRVIEPLIKAFGARPDGLVEAARGLNGERRDHGDASVTVFAFPYVPITLVLWRGDEEFPPEANVLYDLTVGSYLPTEDITLVTQMLVLELIREYDRIRK